MSKIMLVNQTHVEESRVAVLDDGILAAYEIETTNRTSLKGNIYNAVVDSVHASLEAAFVKLGPDLNGFLPIDEVNFKLLPTRSDSRKTGRIGQHLNQGQKLMAQVVREPYAGKPPTVSTYFSLPGRYLVLMPGVDSSGVSRKIGDTAQRERLKKIVGELRAPEGFGVIVRTAGLGQTKMELQRDMRYLLRLWESIQRASKGTEFPGSVYREADLVIRTIRDHFTSDINEVWIDNQKTHDEALAFVRDVMPSRAKTLRLHTGDRPLFNKFNLEEQIERIYKRRVPLPSGGEIVIDGTEALTAIDVNSARSRKQGDLEDNILKTNLEAAEEAARQLRLRDVGGLIVIDFIDMAVTKNKWSVEKCVREAMRGDPARHDITRISKLGLMEIARQRIKGAKMAASYATCSVCDGYGLVKNVDAAGLAALRKLQTRGARKDAGRVRLALPPEVATWLLNNKREELLHFEQRHGARVEIEPGSELLRHQSEFEIFPREREATSNGQEPREAAEPPKAPPAGAGDQAAAAADRKPDKVVPFRKSDGEEAQAEPDRASEEAPPRKSGRRRRRRRRGGGGGTTANGEVPTSAPQTTEEPSAAAPEQAAVPGSVRADELMPAAVGGATARSRRPSGSSRGRSGNGGRSGGRGGQGKRRPAGRGPRGD